MKNVWFILSAVFGAIVLFHSTHLIFIQWVDFRDFRLSEIVIYMAAPLVIAGGTFIYSQSKYRKCKNLKKFTELRLALLIFLLATTSLLIWPPQIMVDSGPMSPAYYNVADYRAAYAYGVATIILAVLNIASFVAIKLKGSS